MKILTNPTSDELKMALQRPVNKLKNIKKIVKPILKNVKTKGDRALIKYGFEYDHVQLSELQVSEEEIAHGCSLVNEELKEAILLAKSNIEKFHRAQDTGELNVETMDGVQFLE